MNSIQNISGLDNSSELRGVLVCDALMHRDRVVISNPKRTVSAQVSGARQTRVKK